MGSKMNNERYWKQHGAPAIIEVRKLLDGISSEKLAQIVEAISSFDCQNCLLRAKDLTYAEVQGGNLSKLEGFLLDALLKESADMAINIWVDDCVEAHSSDSDDESIRNFVTHLEAFWVAMNTSIDV